MTSKQCDHISKHQRRDGLNRRVEAREILETKTKLGVDVMDTKQMLQRIIAALGLVMKESIQNDTGKEKEVCVCVCLV